METAILLGIPIPYVARLRAALDSHGGLPALWSLKFVPAPKKAPEINQGTVRQACRFADEHPSPHVLGFSTQERRSEWTVELEPYFRFRWCDKLVSALGSLATPDPSHFLRLLAADLSEEEQWSSRVKPTDMGSPLLLPECSFSVSGGHRYLWRHARSYGDTENIDGAAKAVRDFGRVYLRKAGHYQWIDDRDLIFGRNGPRHAAAPFPRWWKFSYRLPDGFHYDVEHLEQRKFSLNDAAGTSQISGAKGYINIDPHGYVRRD
jgi:hypothetical protein